MVRGEQWGDSPIFCDQMTTGSFVWLMRQMFMRCRRILKPSASVLCFIDWRQFSNLAAAAETCDLKVNGQIVWDKGVAGMGAGFRSQHEMVLWASRGTARIVQFDTGNVIRCPRTSSEHHPSPKPIELLRKLARVVSEPGDVVVDPFLGGGSTAAALAPLGYRVRGAEIVEGFVRASERHLERSMAQGIQSGLFDEPTPGPTADNGDESNV